MKRVLVLAEGPTEEAFIGAQLAEVLRPAGVVPIAKLLVTKRRKDGTQFKGGVTGWDQVLGDLEHLLGDTNVACVTTMLDYYGLPEDFPGLSNRPASAAPYVRVAHVEAAFGAAVGHAKFVPYLALHEFEALLFADPASWGWIHDDTPGITKALLTHRLNALSPEHIDEGPTTAPSKRVIAAFQAAERRFQKPLHGPLAVESMGIAVVRQACKHFSDWITRLEAL